MSNHHQAKSADLSAKMNNTQSLTLLMDTLIEENSRFVAINKLIVLIESSEYCT